MAVSSPCIKIMYLHVHTARLHQHCFPNQSPFVFLSAFFLSLDEFDAYIIVSFVNATLVLSIGETVEEVTDSGFLGTTPTLSCSLLGEDALVQVSGMYLLDHPYSYLCSY